MSITTIVREAFRPALKCERVGHVEATQQRRGFAYPSEDMWASRYVADSVKQKRIVCGRCRVELTPWAVTCRDGLTGLSMPSDQWDRLKETGFVESR